MHSPDSPEVVVARFLKSHNYERTLQAFLEETGLPADAASSSGDDLSLEKVLEEKRAFDLSIRFEKLGNEVKAGWTLPAPTAPTIIRLPEPANILHVSVRTIRSGQKPPADAIFATTAGKRLYVLQAKEGAPLLDSLSPQDSPILSWRSLGLNGQLSIGTGMSGQVVLYDHSLGTVLSERRDHKKYVVAATTFHEENDGTYWIATAGWDAKVFLYRLESSADSSQSPAVRPCELSAPVVELNLPTNPEDLLFYRPANSSRLILILSRRDSTSLHYYSVQRPDSSTLGVSLLSIGSQNLAPYAAAWSTFTPSALALNPVDPGLIGIATSALPSLKVIVARLLVPEDHASMSSHSPSANNADHASASPISPSSPQVTTLPLESLLNGQSSIRTQAARAALAQQQALEAAVLVHASTQAPQTPYSTPRVAWRPDGSGLWVNGDDGVVRGVEAHTGHVVAVLKGGHEPGCKIRDIWAGWVTVDGDEGQSPRTEEWVVSGGFDRRLVVWRINQGSEDAR